MAQTIASKQSATFLPGSPVIRVERLMRIIATRAQRTIILDDMTFTIPAQSLFAVNGPLGSGKSTLLNMLTGIYRPTSGKVIFAGQELRARGENALARSARGDHLPVFSIGAYAHGTRKRLAGPGAGRWWRPAPLHLAPARAGLPGDRGHGRLWQAAAQ